MPPKFWRVHLRIVLGLPAKNQLKIPSVAWCKTPQVPNSENWRKNIKRHPMPPKLCGVHLRIILSLPAKNQLKIPSVVWGKTPQLPNSENWRKNIKRYPMPLKLCRIHIHIILSLPAKNQLKIPSVAWRTQLVPPRKNDVSSCPAQESSQSSIGGVLRSAPQTH